MTTPTIPSVPPAAAAAGDYASADAGASVDRCGRQACTVHQVWRMTTAARHAAGPHCCLDHVPTAPWSETGDSSNIMSDIHAYTRLTALCPGLRGWAGTRKVKPIWILLKQETVSGSGISWAVCKSAPRSRQITTPAPHHLVFYRPDALPAAQPTVSKHWRDNIVSDLANKKFHQAGIRLLLWYFNTTKSDFLQQRSAAFIGAVNHLLAFLQVMYLAWDKMSPWPQPHENHLDTNSMPIRLSLQLRQHLPSAMLMLCIIRYQFTEVTGPLNTSNGNGWKMTAPQHKNHTLEKKML